jgi:uridylate kinase
METIVMSVGGSLIVPDQIDTDFLIRLKNLIETQVKQDRRFVIICGGGKTARRYQDAASSVATLTPDDLDWLGVHATRLNGHLLRTVFRDLAHPVMITNPDDVLDVPEDTKLIVAAGYRPGSSTDYRAVQIATRVDATKMVNLSNIDHVYTADPRKDPKATPIKDIAWPEFRELIPAEWDPGLSSPFDPVAAKEAEAHGIEVAIINGTNLTELEHYLAHEPFTGTRIHT